MNMGEPPPERLPSIVLTGHRPGIYFGAAVCSGEILPRSPVEMGKIYQVIQSFQYDGIMMIEVKR